MIVNIQLWIKVIFVFCISAEVLLIIFDYVFNYLDVLDDIGFRRIWNIARENSIPTWFSATQAQLLGVTVFLIAVVQKDILSRSKFWAWILIGFFFLFIGIDDSAAIHEKLGGALERMATKGSEEQGPLLSFFLNNPSFSWHTFIAPVFAVCGLMIALFLWLAFWRLNLVRYLVVGFGCWIVAQSIDFLEGLKDIDVVYASVQEYYAIEDIYLVTHTFKVVEEVLEMLGTTLLWVGFLYYFAAVSDGIKIKLEG